jgi:LmbE family N-acetylglucosaminyl deacetylase
LQWMHPFAEYTFGQLLAANFRLLFSKRLMEQLSQLLGTTLMLVAHPDDEVIAFGGLMQRMKKAIVVFATDGAPHDPRFWKDHGSREIYAEVRRQEARQALSIVGAQPVFLAHAVSGGLADQELFRRLPEAITAFDERISRIAPDCLMTLAYEGGHPDHDACCFIASQVGRSRRLPVWESPLYHRNADGSLAAQLFPKRTGQEIDFRVEGEPYSKKVEMLRTYKSQRLVLDGFRPEIEQFRPVMNYDFRRPPFPWKLNYEVWEWAMTGDEVAAEFASYLRARNS